MLEERAPGFFRGPVNSPGGLLKEVARLIYKGDIPDWVDKKQILKELRIFDEVKQVEQKECPICADRRWRTERARSIGTQTVDGDEKEAKKKKKKKPAEHKVAPLAVDTVMTLIGEIYDSVVVQENKVYGAKLQGVPYTQLTLQTEEEAAIALENARGPVAAEAFGVVMAEYGFSCPLDS